MLSTAANRVALGTPRNSFASNPLTKRSQGARALLPRQQQTGSRSRGSLQAVCVADVSEATWEAEVLKSSTPVLVDFWATWCGPCKLVAPLLDAVEKEYGGALKVVKVEADPNPALVDKYQVYGLPTLLLVKDGQVIEGSKVEGAIGKDKLLQYLERHGMAKVNA